ncbi:MAG: DnaJ C-terminal domain-containing protein, partial [Halioglobus sp.]|nr:DnaJ C-terminal domain-containing protein [Halioglobus sp.]
LNKDEGAEERFKEVAEAWEVLGDDERRAEYDELRRFGGRRSEEFEPPPGWRSAAGGSHHHFSGDFSDFFNSVFGAGFEQAARAGPRRGHDIEIEMPVFLEETLEKCRKTVSYSVPGAATGAGSDKTLNVTIPAGVVDGERVRLKGQGAAGPGGGPAGDLFLHIRLVPHPLFDVEGRNLSITVPVAPWEAALGTKVVVPTLEGRINLTIAPRSQSGQRLRVRGKGLSGRNGRGDLYAVLKVVMPPSDSEEVRALWRELGEKAAFDPRKDWGAGK